MVCACSQHAVFILKPGYSLSPARTTIGTQSGEAFNSCRVSRGTRQQNFGDMIEQQTLCMTHFLVHSLAVVKNFALSFFNSTAMSGSNGSSGEGLLTLS